eukprot:NODE_85_length_22318_cov_0.288492.p3 type:complete len:393 gc:universal NODE_85_length_22318_cov_0.288492:18365-19543(+)
MKSNVALFICGIINNVIYVIFLSAASDIFHGLEGLVLLADIIPALFSKSIAPYISMSYDARFGICTVLSILALVLNTFLNIDASLTGVVLASFSSGLGESSFLAISTQYPKAITGWFAGTGMAGILGSFLYFFFTTVLRLSKSTTMLLFSPCPLLLYYAYYSGLRAIPTSESNDSIAISTNDTPTMKMDTIFDKFRIVSTAIVPFMLPLFLVYYSEYLINQGILPTISFELSPDSFFKKQRDYYVLYQMMYQFGVLVSRSSLAVYRIPDYKYLYLLSGLQFLNVWILIYQSLYHYLGFSVVCILVFYEGLLGGSTYANAFACLLEFNPGGPYTEVVDLDPDSDASQTKQGTSVKEFLMSAVSLADTCGITMSGFTCLFLAPWLCHANGVECG